MDCEAKGEFFKAHSVAAILGVDGVNQFVFEVDINAAEFIIFADAVLKLTLGVEKPEEAVAFAEFFELLIAGAIEKRFAVDDVGRICNLETGDSEIGADRAETPEANNHFPTGHRVFKEVADFFGACLFFDGF